jgi:hydrogenase maturation protease
MLIAAVGYEHLRDLSLGPMVIAQLQKELWPPGVELEDLSYGPIGVMQTLDERPAYDCIIFVAGVSRARPPGRVYCYQWQRRLPDVEEIQARVAEAVTGVISLDNLLILMTYFKKLPQNVLVIEVEAADIGWGEGFTDPVQEAIPQVVEAIRRHVRAL